MRIRYTRRAARQLDAILGYIAERSPQGADHVFDRIEAVLAILCEQPGIGRTVIRNPIDRFAMRISASLRRRAGFDTIYGFDQPEIVSIGPASGGSPSIPTLMSSCTGRA